MKNTSMAVINTHNVSSTTLISGFMQPPEASRGWTAWEQDGLHGGGARSHDAIRANLFGKATIVARREAAWRLHAFRQ
jgi:hypothetical protein